ncbi:DNA polymerase, partial [Klebsiella pneumoniae]|uniref:DNA polymerase n=1 Tax=Klebsiella pneumoniae TaxID=573 RepID=UPI003A8934B6
YVNRSYRGGWCYLARGKEQKLFHNGTTADVNSLYPSMMSSESLNKYPIGEPHFWSGDFIPDEAKRATSYY